MTTMEHLFMQIFERRGWIEGQLKQHSQSYGQSLASSVLADGRRPPPWLWNGDGLDPFTSLDPGGLKREQLISGILLPLPRATTPANRNTFSMLPSLKDTLSQLNNFNETCVLDKYYLADHMGTTVPDRDPRDSVRNPDIVEDPSIGEASSEFDPLSRIQRSKSRKRDLEIRLSKKAKTSSKESTQDEKTSSNEESTQDEYAGRVTRSRSASVKADSVKESSVVNNSLHLQHGDGAGLGSSRSTRRRDFLEKTSEPPKALNCTEGAAHKAAESQMDFQPIPSVNMDKLGFNDRDNGVVDSHICATKDVPKELETDAAFPTRSDLRTSFSVASRLPEPFSMVEPRKLLFDGIDECCLKENSFVNSAKEKQDSSFEIIPEKSEILLPAKEDLPSRDIEMEHGSFASRSVRDEEALQCRIEKPDRVSDGGVEEERLELLEVQDFDPQLTSGYQNFDHNISSRDSLGSPMKHAAKEPSSENFEIVPRHAVSCPQPGSPMKHAVKEPGSENFEKVPRHAVSCTPPGSPMRHAGEEPSSENFEEVPRHAVSCTPPGTSSLIELNHALFDTMKESSLNNNFAASLDKVAKSSSSEIPSTNVDDGKLQEDVFPTMEAVSDIQEADIVAGEVQEEKIELSNTSVTKSDPHHISGYQVALPAVSKNSCMETLIQCTLEENCTGKAIEETSGSSVQQISSIHCHGLGLLDEVFMEAETDEMHDVRGSVARSTITPADAGTYEVGCLSISRNPETSGKISGSCKSIDSTLPSPKEAGDHLSGQQNSGNPTTKNAEVDKKPKMVKIQSAEGKGRYFLRSSTSFGSNLSSLQGKGHLPCPEENPLLLNSEIGHVYAGSKYFAEKSVNHHSIMPNIIVSHNTPTKAQYSLRSLTNAASCRSNAIGTVSSSKQSIETVAQACEISWPKRRKMECRSKNVFGTSPRLRSKHNQHINLDSDGRYSLDTASELAFQPISLSSKIENQGGPCLHGNDQAVVAPLSTEHSCGDPFRDLVEGNFNIFSKNEGKIIQSTISKANELCTCGLDTRSTGNTGDEFPNTPSNRETFTEREQYGMGRSLHTIGSTSLSHYDSILVDCEEAMPEFEGFSIGIPFILEDMNISNDSDLPDLTKEPASVLEGLHKSSNLFTPSSCPSTKYKIHKVPDVYQSLPAGLLEQMSLSYPLEINDVDMKDFRESDYGKLVGSGNLGSQCDSSFVGRPYSHSMPFPNTSIVSEARKAPLTPPVMKFSQRVVPGRSGTSSEKVGSNPELICFRIDENSSTTEESFQLDDFNTTEDRDLSRGIKGSTTRKALLDVTAEYQNAPALDSLPKRSLDRGSLDSVESKSYIDNRVSDCSSLQDGHTIKRKHKMGDKENISLSIGQNTVRKASESHRNRVSKPQVSVKTKERNRSRGTLGKGCKPNNIVSNVSSFIPLVRQKKQAAASLKGKKEVKVKALEAAEAAKRLEEKKQNEREKRKAAVKLERERLEMENIRQLELKQKQIEEEKKKKQAEIAARKRQREEEERKEKERKRRCIEETRKQQREQEEKLRTEKAQKELQQRVNDEKEKRKKELAEDTKQQQKSEKGGNFTEFQKAAEVIPRTIKVEAENAGYGSNILEALDDSKRSDAVEKVISSSDGLQESEDLRSYEISPYKDSDDEDEEEESRRERKHIPLWARKENLDQIILSNQHFDPRAIFCRRHSFNLTEVLLNRCLKQPFQ